MLDNLLISIFVVFLNFVVAYTLRTIHKTWLAPSALYALWWSVTTLVSILVGYRETIPFAGLVWILFSSVLIGVGSLIFLPKYTVNNIPDPISQNNLTKVNIPVLRKIYILALFLGLFYIVLLLMFQKQPLKDFTTLEGYLLLAAKFSKERYEDNVVLPMYIKLLLPFVFFACFIGGILFSVIREKKYLLCFIPSIIISALFTEKSSILFCSSMWLSGYLCSHLFKKQLILFRFSTVIKIIAITFVVGAILVLSSFARMGNIEAELVNDVIDKLYSSLFGHIAAFSNWLNTYDFQNETTYFGKYTFAGIFEFFDISKRDQGLYIVNYQLANGELTNLYTIHKGLILDYSIFGTLIVYMVFGIFSQIIFQFIYQKNIKLIGLLCMIYLIIFVSIFVSPLIFNTIFLAVVMSTLVFILI